MKSWLMGLAVIGVIAALIIVVNLSRKSGDYAVDWEITQLPPQQVTIATPAAHLIVKSISAPGTVECRDESEIASEVVGRVIEVAVEEGDRVQKDQILVRLDDEDLQQIVASSRAQVARIESLILQEQAELTKAERDLQRNLDLVQRSAIEQTIAQDSKTTVDLMKARLAMAEAELLDAKANLSRTQTELTHTEIKSPMEGVVADLSVETGEVIIPGTTNLPGTVLMTINDLSHLQVRTRVDQSDIRLVRPGQQAKIYLRGNSNEPIDGEVDVIAPKGTNEGDVVSFETLIRVADPSEEIRVGMTATIEIEVDQSDAAIALPVEAVMHRRLKDLPQTEEFKTWAERQPLAPGETDGLAAARYLKVVFVVENGIAKARPIETGLSDEKFVEVTAGLEEGAQVITGPFRVLEMLEDGQPVLLPQPAAQG